MSSGYDYYGQAPILGLEENLKRANKPKEIIMNEFAIAEVATGKLNALVKNIMRQTGASDPNEAVRLVNSGEWILTNPTRRWREQDGVIYFSVTSNGMTGPQWIEHFEKKGIQLSKWAKDVLLSPDFKPTNGVTTEVAILKGMLFEDNDRITSKIRTEADKRKLIKPEAELGCLIRDTFTDKEIEAMGLVWIVAFHKPIKDSVGVPRLLSADRDGDGPWLSACYDRPGSRWGRGGGFAFAVSQVSSV